MESDLWVCYLCWILLWRRVEGEIELIACGGGGQFDVAFIDDWWWKRISSHFHLSLPFTPTLMLHCVLRCMASVVSSTCTPELMCRLLSRPFGGLKCVDSWLLFCFENLRLCFCFWWWCWWHINFDVVCCEISQRIVQFHLLMITSAKIIPKCDRCDWN